MTELKSKNTIRRTVYNIDAIKAAADAILVAESIGMDIQNGKRISVLCPGHSDRHYGSCFLTERGCHCFVCNKDFDVFDMVKLHCNVDFREAAGIVADLCGGRERFFIEAGDKPDSENSEADIPKIISRSDMQLIGIYSSPVYVARDVVPAFCEPERTSGFRHVWYPGDPDKDEDDYVVIEERVIRNPLLDLFQNEPQAYAELIRNKAWEKLEIYREIQVSFKRHFARNLARMLTSEIRKIEDIIIEYGGSLREPPPELMEGKTDGTVLQDNGRHLEPSAGVGGNELSALPLAL